MNVAAQDGAIEAQLPVAGHQSNAQQWQQYVRLVIGGCRADLQRAAIEGS